MSLPPQQIETHVVIESPEQSAIDLLQNATGLSRQRIKLAMTQGAVWMTRGRNTQRLRRATRPLQTGDEVHLYYDAKILAEIPAAPTLIADVDTYSVWQKPYGLRSQGSKWGDHCTVVRWAEQNLLPQRSAFTVHRLDRAANGLILVAHSKATAAALSKLFRDRTVEKRYRAVVTGDFSGQVFSNQAFPGQAKTLRVEQPIDDKPAVSEFKLLQVSTDQRCSLLDIRIETGRKHQIRRHLAELGYPIVGDRLYGGIVEQNADLQLTAYQLAFRLPLAAEAVEYRLPTECLPTL